MRLYVSLYLILCLSACGSGDQLEVPDDQIDQTVLSSALDWKAIGPIAIGPQKPFVFTCGTFDNHPRELAARDSLVVLIRSKGGVVCF